MNDKAAPDRTPDIPHGRTIQKVITGIPGFDEISGGGLSRGRLTAIVGAVGAVGAGKTVFALQTIINRLITLDEPCIFVTFEEPAARIRSNIASFDWKADVLDSRMFRFVDARIPEQAVVTGAFDIDGLLTGLTVLVEETGARSIVFDGIDMLLSSLQEERLERQELLRLDDWIRNSDISAIVTVKTFGSGDRDQIRADFLLYMIDCLIVLVDTVTATGSSRTLRIAKYWGSGFAGNPVPVVIGGSGVDVVAFKGERVNYPTFSDRLSSGVPRLDALLNGGYLRGSSTLILGSPGTFKTSLAVSFIAATCARGDRALLVSFNESAAQIVANMISIGIDLAPYIETGLLTIRSFLSGGRGPEELMCTSLLHQASGSTELSASQVSTIADTWLHVSYVARDGERHRALTIIKSRGTGHSNQVRELVLNASGIDLVDAYVAQGEVLMGNGRAQKEAEAARLHVLEQIIANDNVSISTGNWRKRVRRCKRLHWNSSGSSGRRIC